MHRKVCYCFQNLMLVLIRTLSTSISSTMERSVLILIPIYTLHHTAAPQSCTALHPAIQNELLGEVE